MSMVQERLEVEVQQGTDDGKKDRAHIVNPPNNLHIWRPGMTARQLLDFATERGLEIVALCGYIWVPLGPAGDEAACEECFAIAGRLMAEEGE